MATKPMVAAVTKELAIPNLFWIDDTLILLGFDKAWATDMFAHFRMIWKWFGFVLTMKKRAEPAQQCESLGFFIDTERLLVGLRQRRMEKIKELTAEICTVQLVSAHEVARFTGVLELADQGFKYGQRLAYPAYDIIRMILPERY